MACFSLTGRAACSMAAGRRDMSDLVSPTRPASTGRSAVQRAALAVGAVFLLHGVLGFVSGVTTNLWSMSLFGHRSGALPYGVFQVSILLNMLHLAFGVAGVRLAQTTSGAHRISCLGCVLPGAVRGRHDRVAGFGGQLCPRPHRWRHPPSILGVAMVLLGTTAS
jgi:hypothetical protein